MFVVTPHLLRPLRAPAEPNVCSDPHLPRPLPAPTEPNVCSDPHLPRPLPAPTEPNVWQPITAKLAPPATMKSPVRAALRGRPGPASQELFSEVTRILPIPSRLQRSQMFVVTRIF